MIKINKLLPRQRQTISHPMGAASGGAGANRAGQSSRSGRQTTLNLAFADRTTIMPAAQMPAAT